MGMIMKLHRAAQCLMFFVFIIFFLSCNENLVIEIPGFSDKIVVEAYICQNSNEAIISLTKTISPYKRRDYADTSLKVRGAKVKIYLDREEFLMQEDTSMIYMGVYGPTYMSSSVQRYLISNVRFDNIMSCGLYVDYGDFHLEAEEHFPKEVRIQNVHDTIVSRIPSGNKYPVRYLSMNITADFPKNESSYYRVSQVTDYVVPNSSNHLYITESEYFCHKSNDSTHFTEIKLRYGNLGYKINKVILYLDHITKNYYDFEKALKAQEENDDSPFGSEGTQIPTNIKNGLGIFTCYSRDSVCLDIK